MALHIVCLTCYVTLLQWHSGKSSNMPFGVPVIWREPTNHINDCYFCFFEPQGINSIKSKGSVYPNLASAMQPVKHNAEIPVPKAELQNNEESITTSSSDNDDRDFINSNETQPQLINQSSLNDLIRDLSLSKENSELLASRLKAWHLLYPGTNTTYYRTREILFRPFFKSDEQGEQFHQDIKKWKKDTKIYGMYQ